MGRGFHTDSSPPLAFAAHLTLDKGAKNHNSGITWWRWPEETVAEKGAQDWLTRDHREVRSRVVRVVTCAQRS